LISELAGAPDEVTKLLNQIPLELRTEVELTNEVRSLADRYISEQVVGRTSRVDCQHIAMATLAKVDVLVS